MNIILLPFNLLCLHMHLKNRTLHRPHNTFLRSHLSPDSTLPAFVVSTPHTPAQRAIARSASISPTRQQAVEANRCNARTASLETSYDQRTPSICTCLSPCLQLHLETNMYWWVNLICQLPCMQQTAPPNRSWVQKKMQEPTNVFDKEQPYHDSMIQSYHNVDTMLTQISPVSTPHASSLRHDERARNHKVHRHKPLKTNSGSQHWQTMTMCCMFRVCLQRL